MEICQKYDAMLMIDECHATGILGPNGRGTDELLGVHGKIDIINSTLGKALGGASGGYTAGPKEIVDLLRQKSRPYLFSNTLAPPVVGAAMAALELLETYVFMQVLSSRVVGSRDFLASLRILKLGSYYKIDPWKKSSVKFYSIHKKLIGFNRFGKINFQNEFLRKGSRNLQDNFVHRLHNC